MYSGLRMRAIVCCAPIFFAIKQLSILNSSDPVTATNKSADETPPASSVSQSAPLPQTPITSQMFVISETTAGSLSTIATLCPSETRLSVMVLPILPQPAIVMFIS